MSTIYTDGDWTIATINGPKRWLRPFPETNAQIQFEQEYLQLESYFTPEPLDTPHPDYPDYYLVAESQLTGAGGGIVKWTRTYSRIPSSRTIYESYAWTVPGIGSQTVHTQRDVSSSSTSGNVLTITASGSVGASAGDSVSVSYTFHESSTGYDYPRSRLLTCLTGTSGSTVKVAAIMEPGGTVTLNTVVKAEPGRDPETIEVWSKLQLDYFLPGVSANIASSESIPILKQLEIYDNTARKTTSFTATTTPTLAEWRSQIAAGDLVCVVQSTIKPWAGNIYERATRYCRAQ
jgi:hypothetical protein